ncbi:MAG: fasciclin domain-containing protein [Chromatiaceae bacterium]|jgi:uncharacterized surface protein with fasciclin (FAS1) repeats|nr:fasciclin domain-containing protein [Chromatiaceae bacterium]
MTIRNSALVTAGLLGGLLISGTLTHADDGCGKGKKEGGTASFAPAVYQPVGMAMPGNYGQPGFIKTGAYGKSAAAPVASGDIVDIAAGAGSFNTLVTAVQAAGLVETLKGEGPFTVFAPTDAAFAKIPTEQLQALLADREALTKVLTYHVVPGKVMAADVAKVDSAKTVEGSSLSIDTSDGVRVDGANVIKTDILASNGVIHVIDTVIIPN